MNILIATREINDLRLLQRLAEEKKAEVGLECEFSEAIRLLKKEDTDIFICEAELAGEEGIHSLVHLREQGMRFILVFIYSEENIMLLKYLEMLGEVFFLKSPVSEEQAERLLKQLIGKAAEAKHIRMIERENHYWESHKKLIQQQFWMRFLNGQMSLDPADFIREAGDCGIEMKLGDTYQIGVLSRKLIRERNTKVEKETRKILLAFANQWFQRSEADFVILEQLRPLVIVRNMPKDEFIYLCEGLIRAIGEEKEIPLCIYYDADIFCENIFSSVLYTMAAEKEDLEEKVGIYPAVQGMIRKKEEISVPMPGRLEELLKNGQWEQVLQIIRNELLEQTARGEITGSDLKAMRLDMKQMIYSVLKEKSIPAHTVFMSSDLKELDINAHISIESFLAWLRASFEKMPIEKGELTAMEAVRNYIREHIREEISRETIAEAFYMNADYLGRLYKKETGESLGNYIISEKMKEAGKMLTTTDLSIGEVCAALGYGNFSHFSKLFKKITGFTPREYRKHFLRDNMEKSGNLKN